MLKLCYLLGQVGGLAGDAGAQLAEWGTTGPSVYESAEEAMKSM